MLIGKKITPYGYKAFIRYDVKNPILHIVEQDYILTIEGEAELTVVTGDISIKRDVVGFENTHQYDNLQTGDTARIPMDVKAEIKSKVGTAVIIEDNLSKDRVNTYLKIPTVKEDEASSDDLNYMEHE